MTADSSFRTRTTQALGDSQLRSAVAAATVTLDTRRQASLAELADADELRDRARDIRRQALQRLPELLDRFEERWQAAGGRSCRVRDAHEAVAHIAQLIHERGARIVVKGKSMASEEIHLNAALTDDGMEVVETDLGEYIIQLAGETPSHIIVPAIHHDRRSVAELFSADAGRAIAPEIDVEAQYARQRLRAAFLAADVGITGVNFAVAESGSICLVENEGNGRLTTALPRVHIAIMGMERIVESFADLDVMLALLARSATGQALTASTSIITGPRRAGEADGPDETHVVIIDNGRSQILGTQFEEVLGCIRCGACLNVCPVYRQVGGHAYGSVYSGPIGAVLTPLLHADDAGARELSEASTLCGACWEACPVRIPLHEMLAALRRRDAVSDASAIRRRLFGAWSRTWASAVGYRLSLVAARVVLRVTPDVRRGPGWLGAWTRTRAVPTVVSSRTRQGRP